MREHAQHPAESPAVLPRTLKLSRKCECSGEGPCECEGGEMKRDAAGPGPASVPPSVHGVLSSGGAPLDAAARVEMEGRFGHDFSRVRVHDGVAAAESARAVDARAYTVGEHVVFGAGMYSPGSSAGQRLLAHELTHVLQQSGTAQSAPVAEISQPGDAGEREADEIAERVMGGRS